MFPAEALAAEMRKRGWHIILYTDQRGMRYAQTFPAEQTLVLPAANPSVRGPVAKVLSAFYLGLASLKSFFSILKQQPDIIVGFGGYPSAPAMLAAKTLRKKHGVPEQNAVLGRVNRWVAAKANFVAHAFPILEKLPTKCRGEIIELGNPVRDLIMDKASAPYQKSEDAGRIELFVVGGSEGASLFSKVVPEAVAHLPSEFRSRQKITQQVRDTEIASVEKIYQAAGVEAELAPFFADIPERMAKAHLIIRRSGASSVTEIATIGRPAILVPLAIAMDDHQRGNATVLVKCDAAKIILEREFMPERLAAALETLCSRPEQLAQMAANAGSAAPIKAVSKLADLIEQTCQAS